MLIARVCRYKFTTYSVPSQIRDPNSYSVNQRQHLNCKCHIHKSVIPVWYSQIIKNSLLLYYVRGPRYYYYLLLYNYYLFFFFIYYIIILLIIIIYIFII